MSSKTFTNYARVVFMATLLWSNGGQAATLSIPDFPLFLTSAGVPPNIIMTLDDSLSMMRGYVPETVDNTQAVLDGPRFKSASVNGLYYDPTKVYKIPTRSDSNVTKYTTTFDNAYFNGFDTSKGQVGNLATNYKVIAQSFTSHSSNSSYSNCTTAISANNNNYSSCLYAKTPIQKVAIGCSISITNSSTNDYIQVSSGPSPCTTIFTGIPTGTKVSIEGSGGVVTSYTVASSPAPTASKIYVGNAVSSNSSLTGAITWWSTTTTAVPAYYYVYWSQSGLPKPPTCTNDQSDDNCYVKVVVSSTSGPGTQDINNDGVINAGDKDERQNFANWFSFYRTRAMTVMSGAMSAITSVDSNGGIRFGWQTINKCTSFTADGCQGYVTTKSENRLRTLSTARKTTFYNWLQRMDLTGSTPMRAALKRVGDHYQTSSAPYQEDPNINTGTIHSCRSNYHVLFTDGLWNSDTNYKTPESKEDIDSKGSVSLPADANGVVVKYTPRAPYQDVSNTQGLTSGYTNPNSLADTAFYYWATDLQLGINNNVPQHMIDSSGDSATQYWNPRNDPASWQHMVNFTIGLGLSASLTSNCYLNPQKLTKDPNNPNPGCPTLGDFENLKKGTKNWPQIDPNIGSNYGQEPDGHVYDLWHAAINSRGKFYSADNPSDVVAAFQDVIDTISSSAKAGGGSRISTNVANTDEPDATAFVAGFNADWIGELEARVLNTDGTFKTITNPDGSVSYVTWWKAGSLIPPGNLPQGAPPFERKIFTQNSGAAQEFASCTGDLQTALNKITKKDPVTGNDVTTTDNLCPQRLAWLRGYIAITNISRIFNNATGKWQATYTAPNHGFSAGNAVDVTGVTPTVYQGKGVIILSTPAPTTNTFTIALTVNTDPGAYVPDDNNDDRVRYADFRDRSSVLGDIVSSGTVYVHQDNFGYGGDLIAVDGGGSTYKTYVEGKAKDSNPPVVYVGANDGMLHAFNAKIDVADGGGQELFAYVPAGVYGNLSALTDPAYGKSHKFFVDGTPTVGDVYIGGWKTYLVGGLRKGGKSIYALDITDPVNFSATNVKWEFKDDNDLGFTFSQPQIAAISANQWAAIFGNGYNSTNGNAVLYIVNLANGSSIKKITVPSNQSSCGNALPGNGLSTPYAFDEKGDGIVDVIYAGDLQGQLWRFDKSSGEWAVGNGGAPLFTACNASNQAQSITAQPKAARIDSKTMVYFGTGRYLIADPNDPTNKTTNDLLNSDVQSFYSIVDESDDSAKQGTVPRSKLLPQEIISSNVVVAGSSYTSRTVTNHKVTDDAYSSRDRGCYLDFTTTLPGEPSERITSGALIRTFTSADLPTRLIFVTSVPTSDPCAKSGISWLMELGTNCGRLEGSNPPISPFDLNGDDKFDTKDLTTIGGEPATVSGLKLSVQTGLVNEITTIGGSSSDPNHGIFYKLLPGTSGKVEKVTNSDDKPPSGGGLSPKRIYWEQIQ